MDIFLISDNQVILTAAIPDSVPARSFLWLDTTHDEVAANPDAWGNAIAHATGIQIYDPHLADAVNLHHPSYFDSTQDYAMVVFRKLALSPDGKNGEKRTEADLKRKLPPVLGKLATQPVTFLLMNRALVTVHACHSRTIDATRNRLLEYKFKTDSGSHGNRPPQSPQELMLRLLNAMVDQYLDLRQPLRDCAKIKS